MLLARIIMATLIFRMKYNKTALKYGKLCDHLFWKHPAARKIVDIVCLSTPHGRDKLKVTALAAPTNCGNLHSMAITPKAAQRHHMLLQ